MQYITCCMDKINRVYINSCNCASDSAGSNCVKCSDLNCTNCGDNGCTSCND